MALLVSVVEDQENTDKDSSFWNYQMGSFDKTIHDVKIQDR